MLTRIRDSLRSFSEHIHILSWVTRLVKQYRLFLSVILFLNVIQMLMGIFFSVYVKQIIDEVADRGIVEQRLILFAAQMLLWTVVGGIFGYCTKLYKEKIAYNVRRQVFHAVLRADWLRISAFQVGDLNARISSDAGEISGYVCDTFPTLAGSVIQLMVTAVIVFLISPMILLILLCGAVVSAALMLVYRYRLTPLQGELRSREVEASSYQTELCENLLTVKSLSKERVFEARFQQKQDRKYKALRMKSRVSFGGNTVMNLFFDLGYLLVFSWAVLNLGNGAITYGMLSMVISLEGYIQGPVAAIASSLPNFVRMLVAADRLNELTALVSETEGEGGILPEGEAFAVTGRNLSFTYPSREGPVLRDFSFHIPAGAFAVIQGPSGCGKTTLLHLILGLVKPEEGTVVISGIPAGRMTRRRIGYVPQGNTLFSGSILDNVCLGDDKNEAAATEALIIADALSFVQELPDGIYTSIQENSRGFSGGQAQRIAIARALYTRPGVLILDEATSGLDTETERRILAAISRLPNRPTVLCVTHRDTALEYADQVITLKKTAYYQ